jgi:hypothetical protein
VSGLYFVATYIEEHPLKVKRIIRTEIISNTIIHALLFMEGYASRKLILYSLFCQIVYYQCLSRFPLLDLSSPISMISSFCVLINHLFWIDQFLKDGKALSEIAAVYGILVWLTPLLFLVSMSNTTQSLPNFGTGWLL